MRILPVVAAVTAAFLVVACSSPIAIILQSVNCFKSTKHRVYIAITSCL